MEEIRKKIVNLIDIQTEIPRERVEKITDQILALFPKPTTMGEEEIEKIIFQSHLWGLVCGKYGLDYAEKGKNELAHALAGKIPVQEQQYCNCIEKLDGWTICPCCKKPYPKQPVKKIEGLENPYDGFVKVFLNEENFNELINFIEKINDNQRKLIAVVNELTKGKE